MSLRSFTDKLIQNGCMDTINSMMPLIVQSCKSNTNTVGGTVTAIGTDGKLTIYTNTGKTLTGVITTKDNVGVGSQGTLLAGVLFIV